MFALQPQQGSFDGCAISHLSGVGLIDLVRLVQLRQIGGDALFQCV